MGINRIFFAYEEGTERGLKVFINTDDQIYIETGIVDSQDSYCNGFVCLSKQDALALAEELKRLADQL